MVFPFTLSVFGNELLLLLNHLRWWRLSIHHLSHLRDLCRRGNHVLTRCGYRFSIHAQHRVRNSLLTGCLFTSTKHGWKRACWITLSVHGLGWNAGLLLTSEVHLLALDSATEHLSRACIHRWLFSLKHSLLIGLGWLHHHIWHCKLLVATHDAILLLSLCHIVAMRRSRLLIEKERGARALGCLHNLLWFNSSWASILLLLMLLIRQVIEEGSCELGWVLLMGWWLVSNVLCRKKYGCRLLFRCLIKLLVCIITCRARIAILLRNNGRWYRHGVSYTVVVSSSKHWGRYWNRLLRYL